MIYSISEYYQALTGRQTIAQGVSPVTQKIVLFKPYRGVRFWSKTFRNLTPL